MEKLTNAEKETIISFNEAEKIANIFTYSHRWKQHLEKKLGLKPIMKNGWGGREYEIDKKRIPLPRAPRNLSTEAKKMLSERGKALARNRFSQASGKVTTIKSEAQTFGKGKSIKIKKGG